MRSRTCCTLASLAGAVLAVAGCSQYNSALGLRNASPQVNEKYQQFLAEYQARLDEGPQAGRQPVLATRFEHAPSPDGASASGMTPQVSAETPQHAPSPADQQQWASQQADPTVTQLGLYGVLPASLPQQRGALDGPDNLKQVTFASAGVDMDPALDPTGQWVLFASTRHRSTPDIYLQKIDGTAVQQITHDPAADRMPALSPDGRHIAFASNRSGNWDIYLTDRNGSQPIQLTSDSTEEIHPSFSPDGSKLVYCTYGSQSGQWEMVVIDVDNPASKRFIGFGLFPQWSPVENKIVFQRARQRGTRWFSVWTIDYENGEGLRPTELAASSNAGAITPHWSPDGKHVVFCTVLNPDEVDTSTPPQADIWMMAADGSERVNLTHNRFANTQPVWSPNGAIYFVSNRGSAETQNVWSIKPDASIRVAATAGRPASVRQAATSPQQSTEQVENVGASVMADEETP